jgi:endonuclease YncB( thermonuclease family)
MKHILAALLIIWASPLWAEETRTFSGPPRILEGDLLRVGDRTVRLYGIDAPDKGQMCQGPSRVHDCGHISATGLMDLTAGVNRVDCEVLGKGPGGTEIARCLDPQGFDLSRQMIYTGWAFATPRASRAFHKLEAKVRWVNRGMWKWQVTAPWEWRAAQK